MRVQKKGMFREVGTALAVLAIYVLTLLAPLHQAAGLQRDLGKIGFETLGAWSVCAPLTQDSDPEAPPALKCPATGVAKQDFVAVLPPTLQLDPPAIAAIVHVADVATPFHRAIPDHVGQSRAPPVAV